MYLWNVKKLSSGLKENKISEKEKMKYFMVMMLIWTLMFSLSALFPVQLTDKLNYLTVSFFILVLTFVGLYSCYQANRDGDNKDFVARFVCISLPINIRLLVVVIAISTLGGILSAILLSEFPKIGADLLFNSLVILATLCPILNPLNQYC